MPVSVQFLPLVAALPPRRVAPLLQLLANRSLFPRLPPRQKDRHRRQRATARQHHPQTPQRQHRRLGLAQLGKLVPHRLRPPVHYLLACHGNPPSVAAIVLDPQHPRRRVPASLPPCSQKNLPLKASLRSLQPRPEPLARRRRALDARPTYGRRRGPTERPCRCRSTPSPQRFRLTVPSRRRPSPDLQHRFPHGSGGTWRAVRAGGGLPPRLPGTAARQNATGHAHRVSAIMGMNTPQIASGER